MLQELGVACSFAYNCSVHPSEDKLMSSNGKFNARFPHCDVTSLIQPMDQSVLDSIKRRYKRKIREELIFRDNAILEFLKV